MFGPPHGSITMQVTAKLKYLRIAPRKTREVVDLIRGKRVNEARNILEFLIKRPARPILKLLNSAVASGRHNFQLEESNLYISKILVDEGPKLKRWQPVSRGRANPIMKRTSHITIVLNELEATKTTKKRKIKKGSAVEKTEITTKQEVKSEIKEGKKKEKKPMIEKIKRPKKQFSFKKIFQRKAF